MSVQRYLVASALLLAPLQPGLGQAPAQPVPLPTGQGLTPTAVPGARFEPFIAEVGPNPGQKVDGAAAVVVSPNRREMLVLTSGFNLFASRVHSSRSNHRQLSESSTI